MLEEDDIFFGRKPPSAELARGELHPPLSCGAAMPYPVGDAPRRAMKPLCKIICRKDFSCHFRPLFVRQDRK